jgi:hypothetical protein
MGLSISSTEAQTRSAIATVEVDRGNASIQKIAATKPEEPSAFARIVHGLDGEVAKGEKMMHAAIDGGAAPLDAHSLIALQAGVYRYGEVVDLASRLVDRAGTAVKTVLQGQ